jgi:hypothetical protein
MDLDPDSFALASQESMCCSQNSEPFVVSLIERDLTLQGSVSLSRCERSPIDPHSSGLFTSVSAPDLAEGSQAGESV